MIEISPSWHSTFPGAALGILAMGNVDNPKRNPQLDQKKVSLEALLREQYRGKDRFTITHDPVMQAYRAYYKRFKKTYHVLLQLESVALKNKSIPRVSTLVEAMFMAELNNLFLTAGHDLDRIRQPITLNISQGDEMYTSLTGKQITCKSGDMVMSDKQGAICSIIYGQDKRTQINPDTRRVIYVVYVPSGIQEEPIKRHLDDLQENVALFSPQAEIIFRNIYTTQSK
jgi:DNA/RNA-binding domain of Phe-tRNA-synthetase-like protein